MRYKNYKLDKWCAVAKSAMIEKSLTVESVANSVGYSRPYMTCVLNGRYRSQKARNKVSEFLQINNYYGDY